MPAGARQQQVTTAHESWRHNRYERPTRTFFVFDLLLDLEDGVGRLEIERDDLTNEQFDVDLHRVEHEDSSSCEHARAKSRAPPSTRDDAAAAKRAGQWRHRQREAACAPLTARTSHRLLIDRIAS